MRVCPTQVVSKSNEDAITHPQAKQKSVGIALAKPKKPQLRDFKNLQDMGSCAQSAV